MDTRKNVMGCVGVVVDITEPPKAEARLAELAAIVEGSDDAIVSISTGRVIMSWNGGAERLFGHAVPAALGRDISLILPPRQLAETNEVIQKLASGELSEAYETVCRHKDGTLRVVSVKVLAILGADGQVASLAAIYRDISARKALEKAVLEIGADERRHIGHELHDGLGQHLAGIAFTAKALEQDLVAEASPRAPDLRRIVQMINEAIQQTRKLARSFDSVDFEGAGLPAALKDLAVRIAKQFRIQCVFSCRQDNLVLDSQANITFYRVAQEAIHNAIQHGAARRIDMELIPDSEKLSLSIRDDGKGFVPAEADGRGMGLRVMAYRAGSVGGSLSVHSEPGIGTRIQLVLPGIFLKEKTSQTRHA